MEHTKSKVTVYQTDDYSLFKFLDGNRMLNKNKIEKIIREIKSGNDILDEVPILVNENKNHLDIVDGQHRFEVAKQLKRHVHYTIKQAKMSLYNVAKVNSNTENWRGVDYINAYSKAGNDSYVKLGAFTRKYRISIGPALSILTFGLQMHDGTIAELYAKFEQGEFEIKKQKEGVQFAELCKCFSDYKAWNKRQFMIAISKIIRGEKCDMDVLLKKFRNDPKQLSYHPDWKGIINNLEHIYNIGNSKRRTIF